MKHVQHAREQGVPLPGGISVVWGQDPDRSWADNVYKPEIIVYVGDRVLEMTIAEASELKRKLEATVMEVVQARLWV